jgi:putative aldouronate transport system permease protein
MIPSFLVVRLTGLINNVLVYIIPGAVSAYNTLLIRNFFQGIPEEMEEAARLDGCSNVRILFSVYLPMSMPILATIVLFNAVGQWNSFFDAILYINNKNLYPVQVYLREAISRASNVVIHYVDELAQIAPQAMVAVTTVASMLPIIIVYPFLQKYFVKGVAIGAVKG